MVSYFSIIDCVSPCKTCSEGADQCTDCYTTVDDPSATLILLYNKQCLDTCPAGSYQHSTDPICLGKEIIYSFSLDYYIRLFKPMQNMYYYRYKMHKLLYW